MTEFIITLLRHWWFLVSAQFLVNIWLAHFEINIDLREVYLHISISMCVFPREQLFFPAENKAHLRSL